ncbi:ABC transporter permease [Janibacter cremeus]|uniref:Simple sugar transport system permease protein n=1 Tax=Janibacter cremeus TaxID=1285192 RepID=A0A852VVY2_9MICO|nr:ABC transporter permease [Janibacter cremeus]NYF97925.1 simple sugar transport system permease protein [Janibacter cremeus]
MSAAIDFLALMIPAMVPFLLAAQGTVISGRTGVFNVSQEGLMVLGASVGFLVSFKVESNTAGLVAAAAIGGVFGLILAYMTTMLRLDQFVVGLALYFASLGLGTLLYRAVVGVTLEPPLIPTLGQYAIPGLSSIPFFGPVLFDHDLVVYFAFILSFGLYWFMYRTNAGLRFRSVGESPKSADSLGINVISTRMWAGVAGGALMAMAGAYLPMVYTGTFTEGMVGGRGWLVIALAFLGGWRPQYVVAGAAFFAGMEVLALRAQVAGIGIPHQFVLMLPYVATLVVMMFAFRWARQPKYLGLNYNRESRLSG